MSDKRGARGTFQARGPTFMRPEEIIERHKDATLDTRQAVVALARLVMELQDQVQALEED